MTSVGCAVSSRRSPTRARASLTAAGFAASAGVFRRRAGARQPVPSPAAGRHPRDPAGPGERESPPTVRNDGFDFLVQMIRLVREHYRLNLLRDGAIRFWRGIMVSVSKSGRPRCGNTESGPRHLPITSWRHRGHNHSSFLRRGAARPGVRRAAADDPSGHGDDAGDARGAGAAVRGRPGGVRDRAPGRAAGSGRGGGTGGAGGGVRAVRQHRRAVPRGPDLAALPGPAVVSGVQEVFDAGHEPAVEWYLPEEIPEELSVCRALARVPPPSRAGAPAFPGGSFSGWYLSV